MAECEMAYELGGEKKHTKDEAGSSSLYDKQVPELLWMATE